MMQIKFYYCINLQNPTKLFNFFFVKFLFIKNQSRNVLQLLERNRKITFCPLKYLRISEYFITKTLTSRNESEVETQSKTKRSTLQILLRVIHGLLFT